MYVINLFDCGLKFTHLAVSLLLTYIFTWKSPEKNHGNALPNLPKYTWKTKLASNHTGVFCQEESTC